jgi:DNA-binding MarR family transcriptional regulator
MSQMQTTPHLDDLLCFSLYAANNAMNRHYLPLLEPLNLTYSQYVVLVVLWEADRLPVTQIGEKLGLESNTLTPLLKRMESAGFISRRRNPKDERQVIIALTAAGRRIQAKAAHIPSCIAKAVAMNLPEVVNLRGSLTKLRGSLSHHGNGAVAGRIRA